MPRKEFFDRCYYGALTRLNGRLYGCAIAAGSDGAGAAAQMQRICRGWRLKPVADPRLGSFKNMQDGAPIVKNRILGPL